MTLKTYVYKVVSYNNTNKQHVTKISQKKKTLVDYIELTLQSEDQNHFTNQSQPWFLSSFDSSFNLRVTRMVACPILKEECTLKIEKQKVL